jgi:hypothetical protein
MAPKEQKKGVYKINCPCAPTSSYIGQTYPSKHASKNIKVQQISIIGSSQASQNIRKLATPQSTGTTPLSLPPSPIKTKTNCATTSKSTQETQLWTWTWTKRRLGSVCEDHGLEPCVE